MSSPAWLASATSSPSCSIAARLSKSGSLSESDLPAAVGWAEARARGAADPNFRCEDQDLTLACILLAQGRLLATGSHVDDALNLLNRLLGAAERSGRFNSVIEIRSLRALAQQALNHPDAATSLEQALRLAEPENYMRVFVEEGVRRWRRY